MSDSATAQSELIEPEYGDILNRLYTLRELTITDIIRYSEYDKNKIKSFVRRLRKYGISLKIDVAYSTYNVKRVQFAIPGYVVNPRRIGSRNENLPERLPYVRSVSTLVLHGVFGVVEVNRSEKIYYKGDYLCLYESIGARPSLHALHFVLNNNLKYILDKSTSINEIIYKSDVELFTRHRKPDYIDLEILRIVSRIPWITRRRLVEIVAHDIGKEEYFKEKNLITHLKHAQYMVRGYRVSKISNLNKSSSLFILLEVKCDEVEDIENAVKHLVTHPIVLGIGIIGDCNKDIEVTPKENDIESLKEIGSTGFELQAYVPSGMYTRVLDLLVFLVEEFGCWVSKVKVVDRGSAIVFTVGSKSSGEYDPKIRGYKMVDIDKLIVKELVNEGLIVPLRDLGENEWFY